MIPGRSRGPSRHPLQASPHVKPSPTKTWEMESTMMVWNQWSTPIYWGDIYRVYGEKQTITHDETKPNQTKLLTILLILALNLFLHLLTDRDKNRTRNRGGSPRPTPVALPRWQRSKMDPPPIPTKWPRTRPSLCAIIRRTRSPNWNLLNMNIRDCTCFFSYVMDSRWFKSGCSATQKSSLKGSVHSKNRDLLP